MDNAQRSIKLFKGKSKHQCPFCRSYVDSPRFQIPEDFTLYGRSLKELLSIIHFAQERGYKSTGELDG